MDEQALNLVLTCQASPACCPLCAAPSSHVHSSYTRTLVDLPAAGWAVRLQLSVRKLFCKAADCPRRIFSERLPELVAPYARKTARFTSVLALLAFALGGRPASRLVERLGMPASRSTLLRLIRRTPEPPAPPPTVIGLDDFAFRKGLRYGTIVVDLETQQPIDVLADRTAETVANWLRRHPGIVVVSRDRSTEYARAISSGAPQARQIADRFHLVKNVREALERLVERNRSHLRGIELPGTAGKAQRQVALPAYAARRPAKRSPAEVSSRMVRREQRQARVAEVLSLYAQGISVRQIAQQLQTSRGAVYRYLRSDTDPTIHLVRRRPSMLDPHLSYLHERWQSGCKNGLQLWQELRERGYVGSRKMVSVWVSQQRQQEHQRGAEAEGGQNDQHADKDQEEIRAQGPECRVSGRSLSYFLLRAPASLNEQEQAVLQQMREASADLASGYGLFQEFLGMMRERQATELEGWLEKARTSGLPDLENFAEGVERDKAAVAGGLSERWNNGQLEGQVNRLKLLKRAMFGRANFDLLRRRVLQTS